jgi:hypothetical protein
MWLPADPLARYFDELDLPDHESVFFARFRFKKRSVREPFRFLICKEKEELPEIAGKAHVEHRSIVFLRRVAHEFDKNIAKRF